MMHVKRERRTEVERGNLERREVENEARTTSQGVERREKE